MVGWYVIVLGPNYVGLMLDLCQTYVGLMSDLCQTYVRLMSDLCLKNNIVSSPKNVCKSFLKSYTGQLPN